MDAFSRQVATFESQDNKEYIKDIGTLNSSLGESARAEFNIDLVLDKSIFNYLSVQPSAAQASTQSVQTPVQQSQAAPAGQTTPSNSQPAQAGTVAVSPTNAQQTPQTKSSEKLITAFHLLLNPEVIGVLDETNYTVALHVPYGTDVKNLTSSIVISPEATVLPASGVSQDFTSPAIYTVTAQDGSVQNYEVRVIVAAPPKVVKTSNQAGFVALIVIILVVIAIVVAFLFLKRKPKKQQTDISKT
jgi:hypothetical protein